MTAQPSTVNPTGTFRRSLKSRERMEQSDRLKAVEHRRNRRRRQIQLARELTWRPRRLVGHQEQRAHFLQRKSQPPRDRRAKPFVRRVEAE